MVNPQSQDHEGTMTRGEGEGVRQFSITITKTFFPRMWDKVSARNKK